MCGHKIRGKEKEEEEEEREGVRMSLRGGRKGKEGEHDRRCMGEDRRRPPLGLLPPTVTLRPPRRTVGGDVLGSLLRPLVTRAVVPRLPARHLLALSSVTFTTELSDFLGVTQIVT